MTVAAAEASGTPADEVTGDLLDGHICRCTGYVGIRAAIRKHWANTAQQHVAAAAESVQRNGSGDGSAAVGGSSRNGDAPPGA